MPWFEIEQSEIHTTTYRVEADDLAEAIQKLMKGDIPPVDNSTEYTGLNIDVGMSVEEFTQEEWALLVAADLTDDDFLPSIVSIVAMDNLAANPGGQLDP